MRGRVASLLEVGTGFHPELTGRENIYLNGSILGMKKREIDAKFDDIVKFSEIEKFLDTPVKRYSSGMYVRLAFAVAGNVWHWRGANNLFFRLAHLVAIAFVVVQAWLGQYCPLTTLESWLRVQAGTASYSKSFIEHWIQAVLFYDAPAWVFALAYTVFAGLVAAAWWRYPRRRRRPQ